MRTLEKITQNLTHFRMQISSTYNVTNDSVRSYLILYFSVHKTFLFKIQVSINEMVYDKKLIR